MRTSLDSCGRLLLGATLVALALPGGASAAQRYAGPTGSGTACTVAAPCDFQVAVNNAMANDEVIVLPGDHGSGAAPVPASVFSVLAIDVHGQGGAPRPRVFVGAGGLELSSAAATIRDVELRGTAPQGAAALTFAGTAERVVVRAAQNTACWLDGSARISDSVCHAETVESGIVDAGLGGTLRNVTAVASRKFSRPPAQAPHHD